MAGVIVQGEKLIYQLIYTPSMAKKTSTFARSPTLDTVLMVEKVIEKNSGEFTRTQLWNKLPKKVMWQTFLVVLAYLEGINKIAYDKNGVIGHIWNPKLARMLRQRSDLEWKNEKKSQNTVHK